MTTRHTLTLYVDVPDAPEGYDTDIWTAREMEQDILKSLRHFERSYKVAVDVEQMSVERVDA